MRRVLIVSPHFCPVNAPDMQRVRLALPYLRTEGWDPFVLALGPETIERPTLDPLLAETFPTDIPIRRVRGLDPRFTRCFGFGALWFRGGAALRRAGDALLREGGFDLVFFSTTQFDFFRLGPRWRKKFGVPYFLDYQDPWLNDYYDRTGTPPPGGRWRFARAQWRARRSEPRVLRHAAGLVAVSPAYIDTLARRYAWFEQSRATVLPFATSVGDLAVAQRHVPEHPLIDFSDGRRHLVYAGRAGPDLRPALSLLFAALRTFRRADPAEAQRLRLHFIGTSYAPAAQARATVQPLATAFGVQDLVHEQVLRVPYFEALHYLTRADGIMAIGSDDPSYTPSKIAACLMVGRPVLALLHAQSPARNLAIGAGATCINFGADSGGSDKAEAEVLKWLRCRDGLTSTNLAGTSDAWTARDMCQRLATAFDSALHHARCT